jgi:hypothetical protein
LTYIVLLLLKNRWLSYIAYKNMAIGWASCRCACQDGRAAQRSSDLRQPAVHPGGTIFEEPGALEEDMHEWY